MTVDSAVTEFCLRNGYGADGGASKTWDLIKFGPVALPIPNLKSRQENLYLHDINHVLTGYETNWQGESSICSWEIATGGWGNLYFPWLLVLGGLGIGVVFYPKSTYAAFQAGLKTKSSFTGGLSKSEMLVSTVDDLRIRLRSSASGLLNRHYFFWAGLGLAVWTVPFLIGLLALRLFW
jgi:hypothetical protein